MKLHAFQKKWLRKKTAEAAKRPGGKPKTSRGRLIAIKRKLKYLKVERALYEKSLKTWENFVKSGDWHIASPTYKDLCKRRIRNTKAVLEGVDRRIKYYERKIRKEKAQII